MVSNNVTDAWFNFETEQPDAVLTHLTVGPGRITSGTFPSVAARKDEAPETASRLILYMRERRPDTCIMCHSGAPEFELSQTDKDAKRACDRVFFTVPGFEDLAEILRGIILTKQIGKQTS